MQLLPYPQRSPTLGAHLAKVAQGSLLRQSSQGLHIALLHLHPHSRWADCQCRMGQVQDLHHHPSLLLRLLSMSSKGLCSSKRKSLLALRLRLLLLLQ